MICDFSLDNCMNYMGPSKKRNSCVPHICTNLPLVIQQKMMIIVKSKIERQQNLSEANPGERHECDS
jgi:hypothetical protein